MSPDWKESRRPHLPPASWRGRKPSSSVAVISFFKSLFVNASVRAEKRSFPTKNALLSPSENPLWLEKQPEGTTACIEQGEWTPRRKKQSQHPCRAVNFRLRRAPRRCNQQENCSHRRDDFALATNAASVGVKECSRITKRGTFQYTRKSRGCNCFFKKLFQKSYGGAGVSPFLQRVLIWQRQESPLP